MLSNSLSVAGLLCLVALVQPTSAQYNRATSVEVQNGKPTAWWSEKVNSPATKIKVTSPLPTIYYNCHYAGSLCKNVELTQTGAFAGTIDLELVYDKDGHRRDERRRGICPCGWNQKHTCPETDQPDVYVLDSFRNVDDDATAPNKIQNTLAHPMGVKGKNNYLISDDFNLKRLSKTPSGLMYTCDEFPFASTIQGGTGLKQDPNGGLTCGTTTYCAPQGSRCARDVTWLNNWLAFENLSAQWKALTSQPKIEKIKFRKNHGLVYPTSDQNLQGDALQELSGHFADFPDDDLFLFKIRTINDEDDRRFAYMELGDAEDDDDGDVDIDMKRDLQSQAKENTSSANSSNHHGRGIDLGLGLGLISLSSVGNGLTSAISSMTAGADYTSAGSSMHPVDLTVSASTSSTVDPMDTGMPSWLMSQPQNGTGLLMSSTTSTSTSTSLAANMRSGTQTPSTSLPDSSDMTTSNTVATSTPISVNNTIVSTFLTLDVTASTEMTTATATGSVTNPPSLAPSSEAPSSSSLSSSEIQSSSTSSNMSTVTTVMGVSGSINSTSSTTDLFSLLATSTPMISSSLSPEPNTTIGTSSISSVNISTVAAPEIWGTSSPVVTCSPPCIVVLPPTTLPESTTITPDPITISDRTTTFPPISTDVISFSQVTVQNPGDKIIPIPVVNPPSPITLPDGRPPATDIPKVTVRLSVSPSIALETSPPASTPAPPPTPPTLEPSSTPMPPPPPVSTDEGTEDEEEEEEDEDENCDVPGWDPSDFPMPEPDEENSDAQPPESAAPTTANPSSTTVTSLEPTVPSSSESASLPSTSESVPPSSASEPSAPPPSSTSEPSPPPSPIPEPAPPPPPPPSPPPPPPPVPSSHPPCETVNDCDCGPDPNVFAGCSGPKGAMTCHCG